LGSTCFDCGPRLGLIPPPPRPFLLPICEVSSQEMKLTILNCTSQELSYSWISTAQDAPQTTEVVAFPSAPIIIDNLPGKKLRITTGGKSEKHKEQPQASVDVDLKNKLGLATRSYRMLEVAENSPFRVFLVKVRSIGFSCAGIVTDILKHRKSVVDIDFKFCRGEILLPSCQKYLIPPLCLH